MTVNMSNSVLQPEVLLERITPFCWGFLLACCFLNRLRLASLVSEGVFLSREYHKLRWVWLSFNIIRPFCGQSCWKTSEHGILSGKGTGFSYIIGFSSSSFHVFTKVLRKDLLQPCSIYQNVLSWVLWVLDSFWKILLWTILIYCLYLIARIKVLKSFINFGVYKKILSESDLQTNFSSGR